MKVSNKNWNDAQLWFLKNAIFYRNVFHARMIAHTWEVRHFDMKAVLTADFLGTFKSSVGSACTSVTIVSSGFGHSYGDLLTLVVTDYSTQMIKSCVIFKQKKPSFLDCIGVSIKSKSEFKTYTLYFYTLVYYFLM